MKKTIFLISIIVIILSMVGFKSITQASAANFPASIDDLQLREAWSQLDQLRQPVQLWDGRTLSGHDLAQFVLVHAVPIVWDTDNHCSGGSCSARCVTGSSCAQSDGSSTAHPIYISLSLMAKKDGQKAALLDALAHEIYHYTLPFGAVDDSLFEEFSAYYVGETIASNLLVNFDSYNALRPVCLVKWFYDTQTLPTYQNLYAYPQAVLPAVDASATICPQPVGQVVSADSPLTCSFNAENKTDCVFPHAPTHEPESHVECKKDANGLTSCETIYSTQETTTQATPEDPQK